MIKFYCRGCGKEMWTGFFESLKQGNHQGDTIDQLWESLWCTDCVMKRFKKES
jgi:hypothetical protein